MTLAEKIILYLTKKLGHSPSNKELTQELNGAGLLILMESIKYEYESEDTKSIT